MGEGITAWHVHDGWRLLCAPRVYMQCRGLSMMHHILPLHTVCQSSPLQLKPVQHMW
jgi:hypothetical protein